MNAAAMSTFRMTADAGYILGPPGLGLLADATSPAIAILAGSAVLILLGGNFRRRLARKGGAFGRSRNLNSERAGALSVIARHTRSKNGVLVFACGDEAIQLRASAPHKKRSARWAPASPQVSEATPFSNCYAQ